MEKWEGKGALHEVVVEARGATCYKYNVTGFVVWDTS